jgi:short-subunit dehydrogenase
MTSSTRDVPAIDPRHLLIIGAGPGLGSAIGRRFAQGGYHLTLLARSADGVGNLAKGLVDTGAVIDTVTADAADPEGLRATLTSLYGRRQAPGLLVYNASQFSPDTLLNADIAHMHQAYDVDVVSAVMAAQVAAPAMGAGGGGTIIFTGGGFADHPVSSLATLSIGKAALRSAATMLGEDLADDLVRVASITILGPIAAGTPFDPDRIAETYWSAVHSDSAWQSEFRFDGS